VSVGLGEPDSGAARERRGRHRAVDDDPEDEAPREREIQTWRGRESELDRAVHPDHGPVDHPDTWMELRLVTVHGDTVLAQELLWVGEWLTVHQLQQLAAGWGGPWRGEASMRRPEQQE
jgi:hypothetical protein